jgi:chorismate synthase
MSITTQNPFFCPDESIISDLENYMDTLRKSGNSVGAKITVVASGVPVGLGEPIFDRLDAEIAHSLMSINAAKGVEIGSGFDSIMQFGTDHRDIQNTTGFSSNNAGGILGGISSGQDIVASVAFKPTSSLHIGVENLDKTGKMSEVITKGRHDPCVGIRATPIVEAMLAITLMDHFLRNKAQNG